jgi:1-acyl-sn-glycerol-3-phosphate acyltransferase
MRESTSAERRIPTRWNWTDLFGHLWALWALILFVSSMLVFFIPFLLFSYFRPEPQKTRRFILFSRTWMKVFLTGVGCPLKVKGRENFKKGETYIVICNHNALIDVPISSPGIPGGNKTIAKIEMANTPLFGMLYRTGSVLVDRKNDLSRRESYNKMKEVLNLGLHMCIYPEGTRNKTDQPLKSFHDGAFRLAVDTGMPIIPGLIFNSRLAMPLHKTFYLRPVPLALHFLEPVPIAETDTVGSLKEKLFEIMKNYYLKEEGKI